METYLINEASILLKRNNITLHLLCVGNENYDLALDGCNLDVGAGDVEFHVVRDNAQVGSCISALTRDRFISYLICHSPWDGITGVALEAAKQFGLSSIVYYHGGDDPMRLRQLRQPQNQTITNIRSADRVAVVSQAGLRAVVQAGVALDRVVMIGPMLNARIFYPCAKIGELVRQEHALNGRFVFLSPSRSTRLKGQLELLQAAALLKKEGIGDFVIVMFEISGNNFGDRLKEFIVAAGLQERVIFVQSPIPQTALRRWYAAADAVVLPSYTEGFGQVLAEAELMKKIVIGTNASGIREAMNPDKSGFVAEFMLEFDPSSPGKEEEVVQANARALAGVMRKAMTLSPQQRQEMGEAGRQFIWDNYHPEDVVSKGQEVMLFPPQGLQVNGGNTRAFEYDYSGKQMLVFSTQYFTANGVSKHVEAINRLLLERHAGWSFICFISFSLILR